MRRVLEAGTKNLAAGYVCSPHKAAMPCCAAQVNFKRPHWEGISDEAKDFVKQLLNKVGCGCGLQGWQQCGIAWSADGAACLGKRCRG